VPVDELTCQELVEIVTEYLEGSMAAGDRRRFEEHLVVCPGCSTYLEQLRETVRLTGVLATEDLAAAERDALLRTFRDWKGGRDPRV
jgi:predicted anti-sigma-YlaC factor YlaD